MKKTHKKHNLTKSTLYNLYCKELLSDREIGEKFNLTGEGVAYYRKKFGIKTITASEKISAKANKKGLIEFSKKSPKSLA